MRTDDIKSLDDFKFVREQMKHDIDMEISHLENSVDRLKYELTPSTFTHSLWSRLSGAIVDWVERKLS